MPLYMDLHISPDGKVPIEDLVEKHQADLAAQEQFGVAFKGVWLNEEKGMVFCLMEGPDRDACNAVHQHAHGDEGCNIVEVNPGDFDKFLSGSIINSLDLAESKAEVLDNGYRTILNTRFIAPLSKHEPAISTSRKRLKKYNGSLLVNPDKNVEGVFVHASDAHHYASEIKNYFDTINPDLDYRIAIVSGCPVDENHDAFYGYSKDLAKVLTTTGEKGCIRTTDLTFNLLFQEIGNPLETNINMQVLSENEESFLHELYRIIEANFRDPNFTASDIIENLHISRSQLFRKSRQVTNFTPNVLIKEIRLLEALKELDKKQEQISEIAFKTGFNSPSYFTKVFNERFDVLPSDYANQN